MIETRRRDPAPVIVFRLSCLVLAARTKLSRSLGGKILIAYDSRSGRAPRPSNGRAVSDVWKISTIHAMSYKRLAIIMLAVQADSHGKHHDMMECLRWGLFRPGSHNELASTLLTTPYCFANDSSEETLTEISVFACID